MLLSGNSWAFIFTLAASYLILNSLASAIPVFPRDQPSSVDISSAVNKIEKLLKDECDLPAKDKDGKFSKFPEMCERELGENEELELQKEKGGDKHRGLLGPIIGRGDYGDVFEMDAWSGDTSQVHVAKWLMYKDKGLEELRNGLFAREVADYGVSFPLEEDAPSFPHLWIIMPRKAGYPLRNLEPYHNLIRQAKKMLDREPCFGYMTKVREAIVDESKKYMVLPGGLIHNDLHRNNVLFWYDDKGEIHANLIDWGKIKRIFENDHDKIPSDGDVEDYAKKLAEELRGPSSKFNDEYNCVKRIPTPKPNGLNSLK